VIRRDLRLGGRIAARERSLKNKGPEARRITGAGWMTRQLNFVTQKHLKVFDYIRNLKLRPRDFYCTQLIFALPIGEVHPSLGGKLHLL
jgi:hypothetical protein